MSPEARRRLNALYGENQERGERMARERGRFMALAHRHANGTAPRAVAAFNLFQTPQALAARMVAVAELRDGMRILEPSAGLGRILDAIAADPSMPLEVIAVEESKDCARELYHKHQTATLRVGDFLSMAHAYKGTCERVIMNPPFKQGRDIKHIMAAFDCLAPDGLLVSLCYNGSKQNSLLKPWADTWEVLPPDTFKAEGTSASVALLTKRHP